MIKGKTPHHKEAGGTSIYLWKEVNARTTPIREFVARQKKKKPKARDAKGGPGKEDAKFYVTNYPDAEFYIKGARSCQEKVWNRFRVDETEQLKAMVTVEERMNWVERFFGDIVFERLDGYYILGVKDKARRDMLQYMNHIIGCPGRMGGACSFTAAHMWIVAIAREFTAFVEGHF